MTHRLLALLALTCLTGCAGELTVLAALAFSMTLGAWLIGRDRQRRALGEAHAMRRAIASGQHRAFEEYLQKEIALAEAGEAVSMERQWLARAQLGGLLTAEWRLDEARELYDKTDEQLSPLMRTLAAFGRHQLAVLTETPDDARLSEIRRDRDVCLAALPVAEYREPLENTWHALEGLCLVRMGRAREAVPLLERGLGAVEFNATRVVYLFHLGQAYEHIGERKLASDRYAEATTAFPGTRLASEANARLAALGPGAPDGFFRGMLPEAPGAPVPAEGPPDDEDPEKQRS